jgi:hypothetical protein
MHSFTFYLLLLLFSFATFLYSQEGGTVPRLPSGLGISNQLEYSYDHKLDQPTFENWLNLDYRHDFFSTGIRFDVFQPNDPNPAISRGKEKYADIAFKYVRAEFGDLREGFNITAGNFYELFSYGMILKSYEDRNIRIDNNLSGIKVNARYRGFNLTALSGSMETALAERRDILHAADLEYRLIRNLRMGVSYATNIPYFEGVARTNVASVRIRPTLGVFDFYAEYGLMQNEDIRQRVFSGGREFIGRAFYGSASFYEGQFSLIGEVKYYDNFTFAATDGSVIYNTPPAVKRDHTYSLLNRHPSPLNQSNEQGFQLEANYFIGSQTSFVANFNLTETLPPSSLYQQTLNSNVDVRTQFKELFTQLSHQWSDNFYTNFAFGFSEELDGSTRNFTPIVEAKYYLDGINTFRVILEHQQTENLITAEKYFTDLLLLEYLRSPWFSISLAAEMQTLEPEPGKIVRPIYKFIQTTFKIGQHSDLSLLFGSRQAGNICVGGVCRYEPEFNGVEIKLLSRL